MFQRLVNRNDDLRRLVEKGYAVAFDDGFLIIRDIPYLDSSGALQWGAIVAKLVFVDAEQVTQDNHQVFFAGGSPHGIDGKAIANIGDSPTGLALSAINSDIVVQRAFSVKLRNGGKPVAYADFFEKIESYVALIAGPAMERHGVNPYTFRAVTSVMPESVFKFHDTLTSRAEIGDLSRKLKEQIVAIIGLGGTGGYVLDFLVKTPVKEIRGFDADPMYVHNTFRSPGRMDASELGKTKAEVYGGRYGNFRSGLSLKAKFIDQSCADELTSVTFAFVCVDKGPSRAAIFDLLISLGIPFIDVGMGIKRRDGLLNGMLRTTYYAAESAKERLGRGLAELTERPADLYRSNIQIGELNALNACLAVIRFKQLCGFYFEEFPHYHLAFEIADLKIVGEWE